MSVKPFILAAAVASAVTFASTAAKADPHIGIGIGLGFGDFGMGVYDGGYATDGYGDGYGYAPTYHRHHHHWHPAESGYFARISCGTAANIVRRSGYRGVTAYDCSAPVYAFQAWRYGEQYDVRVNFNGRIVSAHPAY